MDLIKAPLEIDICFGQFAPSDDLSDRVALGPSGGPRDRGAGVRGDGLRRNHQWAGSRRGTHGASNEQLGSPGVFGRLRDMRDRGLITNEQCVALATAAVGIRLGGGAEGSHVASWRRGEAAEAGDLVAGTPIATFLDRSGRTGNTYAIGGNGGQPGAHLDHAAVFQRYLTDHGQRVGMEVSEQYKGSGGQHEHAYYFNNGWGEGDASNYHAIDTARGHLGGTANPLTARDYHAAAVKAANDATPSLGTQ